MNRQISIYGTPGQLKYDIKMGHLIMFELLDTPPPKKKKREKKKGFWAMFLDW